MAAKTIVLFLVVNDKRADNRFWVLDDAHNAYLAFLEAAVDEKVHLKVDYFFNLYSKRNA